MGGKQGKSKSKGKGKKKGKQGKQGARRQTMAERADIHALYEKSVQSPEADCELFAGIYEELLGAAPQVLREDFCGTAQLSCAWVLSERKRRAIGVDFDGPTLDWARSHNLAPKAKAIGDRLTLVQADVLEVDNHALAKADIVAALNFSFCVFKQREQLERYCEQVYTSLAERGLVFFELFGGTKAIDTDEEVRELDGFTYVWEQESFNPISNEILCHIHFQFEDGSKIERAFTYDWRLWSLPELRDLLYEVGFAEVRVYWEKVEEEDEDDEDEDDEDEDEDEDEDDEDDDEDEDDEMLSGTGEYEEVEVAEQQDSWLVYVVAEKRER